MKKLKIITVVGTRPEIIRLACIMKKLDEHCDHILIHTGQNYDYELNEIFFDDLGIRRPDYFLNAAGSSSAETIGNVIIKVDKILAEVKPEAMLVLGDTNSCMAVLPAKRRKIPTFHMEAGNRCFDQRVPEEINRRLVDHMADINLTYSSIARDYLLSEGLPADMIIKTGSPMFEVINTYRSGIDSSDILFKLNLKKYKFFVVSIHREENVDSEINIQKFVHVLDKLAKKYGFPIVVSTHPRTRNKIEALELEFHPLVNLIRPLGFSDYVKLQCNAKLVLSDSGTITEESSIMNFPALNIREAQERPEGLEEGAVMFTGMEVDRILQAITILEDQPNGNKRLLRKVGDYEALCVSDKVVRIIMSYTDLVNRIVWRKY